MAAPEALDGFLDVVMALKDILNDMQAAAPNQQIERVGVHCGNMVLVYHKLLQLKRDQKAKVSQLQLAVTQFG
jgi:hypothetical protein